MSAVVTEHLTKTYGKGAAAVTALNDVSVSIDAGEFVAVMGPSGSGKSTLLHLVGGLDRPSSGRVIIGGEDLSQLNDDALTRLRRRNIGFVFQFFNLIPVLSATENAALPLILDGTREAEAHRRAQEWLERLGMGARTGHRPDQLSGGEQQRVAIARALASEPTLLVADEPTGNLDSRAADDLASLLRRIADEWERTVLLVTHDPRIAAHADRIVFLKDGSIVDQTHLANGTAEQVERALARAKGETA